MVVSWDNGTLGLVSVHMSRLCSQRFCSYHSLLLMGEIQETNWGWLKPCKQWQWHILHINWCRIHFIDRMKQPATTTWTTITKRKHLYLRRSSCIWHTCLTPTHAKVIGSHDVQDKHLNVCRDVTLASILFRKLDKLINMGYLKILQSRGQGTISCKLSQLWPWSEVKGPKFPEIPTPRSCAQCPVSLFQPPDLDLRQMRDFDSVLSSFPPTKTERHGKCEDSNNSIGW